MFIINRINTHAHEKNQVSSQSMFCLEMSSIFYETKRENTNKMNIYICPIIRSIDT